jgi:hypothetical protein
MLVTVNILSMMQAQIVSPKISVGFRPQSKRMQLESNVAVESVAGVTEMVAKIAKRELI